MPLGDFFAPDPLILCPLCGTAIPEWEGFGGPGAFALFKQGQAEPVEHRLASQMPDGGAKLEDGRIPLFATCVEQHALMAEAIVEGGIFEDIELCDADGGMRLPLSGAFVLWRPIGSRYAISTRSPTKEEGVIPSAITAVGYDDACILATRRRDTRDPKCVDEWYVADVRMRKVLGPIPDDEVKQRLADLGLREPDVMDLPEDVA